MRAGDGARQNSVRTADRVGLLRGLLHPPQAGWHVHGNPGHGHLRLFCRPQGSAQAQQGQRRDRASAAQRYQVMRAGQAQVSPCYSPLPCDGRGGARTSVAQGEEGQGQMWRRVRKGKDKCGAGRHGKRAWPVAHDKGDSQAKALPSCDLATHNVTRREGQGRAIRPHLLARLGDVPGLVTVLYRMCPMGASWSNLWMCIW